MTLLGLRLTVAVAFCIDWPLPSAHGRADEAAAISMTIRSIGQRVARAAVFYGVFVGWLAASGFAAPARAADAVYALEPGDILEVSVWKEEDLQREVVVRPDGGITFPLVGEVKAAGRTVDNVRQDVAERLRKFIPEPNVTVAIRQPSGNRIYVIGRVNSPGEFVITRTVDVVQALSMAGGMTPFASVDDIKVLRRIDGTQKAIPFSYGDVEAGDNLEQNIVLRAGDTVVVP